MLKHLEVRIESGCIVGLTPSQPLPWANRHHLMGRARCEHGRTHAFRQAEDRVMRGIASDEHTTAERGENKEADRLLMLMLITASAHTRSFSASSGQRGRAGPSSHSRLTFAAVEVCCTELTSTPVAPGGMPSALRRCGFSTAHKQHAQIELPPPSLPPPSGDDERQYQPATHGSGT